MAIDNKQILISHCTLKAHLLKYKMLMMFSSPSYSRLRLRGNSFLYSLYCKISPPHAFHSIWFKESFFFTLAISDLTLIIMRLLSMNLCKFITQNDRVFAWNHLRALLGKNRCFCILLFFFHFAFPIKIMITL
jgi:hypothetical protein